MRALIYNRGECVCVWSYRQQHLALGFALESEANWNRKQKKKNVHVPIICIKFITHSIAQKASETTIFFFGVYGLIEDLSFIYKWNYGSNVPYVCASERRSMAYTHEQTYGTATFRNYGHWCSNYSFNWSFSIHSIFVELSRFGFHWRCGFFFHFFFVFFLNIFYAEEINNTCSNVCGFDFSQHFPLYSSRSLALSLSSAPYLSVFGCVGFGFALGSSTDDDDGDEGLCTNVHNEVLEMELSNVNALIICHCTHVVAVCNVYATHMFIHGWSCRKENETRQKKYIHFSSPFRFLSSCLFLFLFTLY